MATPQDLIEWIEEGCSKAKELGVTPNVILVNWKFKPLLDELERGIRKSYVDIHATEIFGMKIRYEFLPDDVNFVLQREIKGKDGKPIWI